jgi:hypothetical protein
MFNLYGTIIFCIAVVTIAQLSINNSVISDMAFQASLDLDRPAPGITYVIVLYI